MLHALRRWASGWVAFILISLLILSFAVWGIGDMITGYGRGVLASVGGSDISEQEFQQAFQDELNAISQRAGQRITYDQARAVGLDNRVLSRMIGSTAVEKHAKELNLGLSDEELAAGLKNDPMFQGPDGKFSRVQLDGMLRQMGFSEARLLELRRSDELRQQLTSAFLRGVVVPDLVVNRMHDWREESRVLSHFTIDAEKVAKVAEPDEETLKKYYDTYKADFMTPTVRHLAVLTLPLNVVMKQAPITDEQVKAAYEQTKHTFDVAEKRQIEQIPFSDAASAQAAKTAIDGGQSFVEAAKLAGASETDIKLGLLEKSQMIDKDIANAAFALEKDAVSEVVKGKFTTVLLRVSEIQPGKESTFDEVKDKVRETLEREWASAEIQNFYNEVDDGRAGARPLKDIAATLKLPFFDIPESDRNNKTIDGVVALDVPDAAAIVAAGFAGQMGVEADPVPLSDGGYAWVDVLGVKPPAQKPFEAVKDEVKASWIDRETRKMLSEAAANYTERLKTGGDIAVIAEEAGGTVETTPAVTRTTIPPGLTQGAISQAFVLPSGGAGSTETADGKSRTVFRIDEIKSAPAMTPEQKTALSEELLQQFRADQIGEYLAGLQSRLGVTINQAALRRLTGADTGTP